MRGGRRESSCYVASIIDCAYLVAAAAGARASYRFFEFFTAQIRNPHTRRAYARARAAAAAEFFDWPAARGVTKLAAIESVHVAAYIEQLQKASGYWYESGAKSSGHKFGLIQFF